MCVCGNTKNGSQIYSDKVAGSRVKIKLHVNNKMQLFITFQLPSTGRNDKDDKACVSRNMHEQKDRLCDMLALTLENHEQNHAKENMTQTTLNTLVHSQRG